jgi:hypothetical protein
MADSLDQTLSKWGAEADDDNDLRTEAGIQAYGVRYAKRHNVALDVAMQRVQQEIAARKAEVSQSGVPRIGLRQ